MVKQVLKTLLFGMLTVMWLLVSAWRVDTAPESCSGHECSSMAYVATNSVAPVSMAMHNPIDAAMSCSHSVCCTGVLGLLPLLSLLLMVIAQGMYQTLTVSFVSHVKTALWRPPQTFLFSPAYYSL